MFQNQIREHLIERFFQHVAETVRTPVTREGETPMYRPKIREDLIRRLYHLAKARRVPMTRLIDEILENALGEIEAEVGEVSDPPSDYQKSKPQRKGGRG